jgi:hypothetical protein
VIALAGCAQSHAGGDGQVWRLVGLVRSPERSHCMVGGRRLGPVGDRLLAQESRPRLEIGAIVLDVPRRPRIEVEGNEPFDPIDGRVAREERRSAASHPTSSGLRLATTALSRG